MVLSGNCTVNIVWTGSGVYKKINLVYCVGCHSPSLHYIDGCQTSISHVFSAKIGTVYILGKDFYSTSVSYNK